MDSEDDENILNIMENLEENVFTDETLLNTSISPPISSQFCSDLDHPSQEHLDCLKSKFGHTEFRSIQWKVIKSIIMDRQDNCVIMATGYGKSLCYQYPSVYLNGLTIVVSPLISLMEDQVLNLNLANIPACLLGSAQKNPNIKMEIMNGQYRVVYMSPEYLSSNYDFLKELEGMLSLIAIDEAHCVSQWGHDFRPCYRNLGKIRENIESVPVLAVTATATKRVRNDICSVLKLHQPQILCTGFDRPNLNFTVRLKTSPWSDLSPFLMNQRSGGGSGSNAAGGGGGSIIIYCLTRKLSMDIMSMLKQHSIKCEAYHAGLGLKQRSEIHENFVHDRLQVIVATVAFGMGIDKPDVRLVIHYGASKDIESYYQEVGRAGRDGRPAKCILFYGRSDFALHRALRSKANLSETMKKHLDELSRSMQDYILTEECRRLKLLQYFEGCDVKCLPRSDCCDNCRRPKISRDLYVDIDEHGECDFGKDARILLQGIDVFNGHTGLVKPLALIRGSKSQAISQHQKNLMFGRGKHKSEGYWKSLFDLLKRENFIIEKTITHTATSFPYQVIKLTITAHKWLSDKEHKLLIKPNQEILKYMKKKYVTPLYDTTTPTTDGQSIGSSSSKLLLINENHTQNLNPIEILQKSLYACRLSLASQYNVMPYMIASNLALEQLSHLQPLNLEELIKMKIDGFSEIRISKFGPEIIKCIIKHLKLLPSSNEQIISDKHNQSMFSILQIHPIPNNKLPPSTETIWELINKDLNIEKIAMHLYVQESTVVQYICQLIKAGYEITKLHLHKLANITMSLYEEINNQIPIDDSIMTIFLRQIKENLPEIIDWNQIKLVLAYKQVRYHLNKLQFQYYDPDAIVSADADNSEDINMGSKNSNIFEEDPVKSDLNELLDDSDELFADFENEKLDKYFVSSNETVMNEENIGEQLQTLDNVKNPADGCSQTSNNLWEDENDDLFLSMPLNENFTSPPAIQSSSNNNNKNSCSTQINISQQQQQQQSQFLKRTPIKNRIQYCSSSSSSESGGDGDDAADGNTKINIKTKVKQTPRKRILPSWMKKTVDTGNLDNKVPTNLKIRRNIN